MSKFILYINSKFHYFQPKNDSANNKTLFEKRRRIGGNITIYLEEGAFCRFSWSEMWCLERAIVRDNIMYVSGLKFEEKSGAVFGFSLALV